MIARLKRKATTLGLVLGMAVALGIYAHAEVTEEFHKSYPLAQNGTFSLHNVNGAVRISAWDRNEVKVDAIKTGETQQNLNEAQIVVNAGSSAIDVRTKYPENSGRHAARVEYTITVPAHTRIEHVETVNGSITVEGIGASVQASTVNGKVDVNNAAGELRLNSVNGELRANVQKVGQKVAMECVNCRIELTVPSDTNAEVAASTVNGSIANDFEVPVRRPKYGPGNSMRARLGSGGSKVNLSAVNGTINLRHAADGKPVSKATNVQGSDRSNDEDMD